MTQQYKTLIEQFESGQLKEDQFHHREHLVVCLWYVSQYPELEAIIRIKFGIMNYNFIFKVPQSEQRGYHETITLFFIHLAQTFLKSISETLPFDQKADLFVETHPDLWTTLNRHYTKDYLWSPSARRYYMKPDLEPL